MLPLHQYAGVLFLFFKSDIFMKTDTKLTHRPFSAVSGVVLSIKFQLVRCEENTAQMFGNSMLATGV